jgi:hypothetical protein
MKPVDLFYQGQGISDIEHLEVGPEVTFGTAKGLIGVKHNLPPAAWIFVEDEDDPIEDAIRVIDLAGPKGVKVHVHCCRRVDVAVTFNGEAVERRFPPSTTVARVKRWAAEHKFGMSEEEAGEHVLQIAGTHDRPAPGAHVGRLTDGKVCRVEFDLVADERVNGALEGRA